MTLKQIFTGILSLLIMALITVPFHSAAAQDARVLIWVYDKNVMDSHFGYYDGQTTQLIGSVYQGVDVEGLACLNNTIYGSGGGDGKQPSVLYTLSVTASQNQATLTSIGEIRTADQQAFFEVVALAVDSQGALWGYADWAPLRGIIRIDSATGVAELIKASDLHVEGAAWLGDVLWLTAGNKFYRWTLGGEITYAFTLSGDSAVEGLESIDGILFAGVHEDDRGVIAVDTHTGAIIPGLGFPAPNDTEGMTYCPLHPEETPTSTATVVATETATATPTSPETPTETPVATITETPVATATPTETTMPVEPTVTETPTPTATVDNPTPTATPSPTPTGSVLGVHEPTDLDETDEPARIQVYFPFIVR